MASRHTATGIRTVASLCHGTGWTLSEPGPEADTLPVKTVPLNNRIIGTRPSSRAARYLWPATSTS